MKLFTKYISEAEDEKELPSVGCIGYISNEQLEKYVSICKHLAYDAKMVLNYIYDHDMVTDKTLASIMKNPSTPEEDVVSDALQNLLKNDKIYQVPNFLSPADFASIISGDKVMEAKDEELDLTSEEGRAAVVKQFTPLVYYVAKSYYGKSGLSNEDVVSAGFYGLTMAMNKYDASQGASFKTYAQNMIRTYILEEIKDYGSEVRIPRSAQKKERSETGSNTKQNNLSGDEGSEGKDGEINSFFSKLAGSNVDNTTAENDAQNVWQDIFKLLSEEFSSQKIEIFKKAFGIGLDDKVKGKELAKEYGMTPSRVTAILKEIIGYIKKTPEVYELFQTIYDYYFDESVKEMSIVKHTNYSPYFAETKGRKIVETLRKRIKKNPRLLPALLEQTNGQEILNEFYTPWQQSQLNSKSKKTIIENYQTIWQTNGYVYNDINLDKPIYNIKRQ
jgi:RNA polymerase sigma factor (sigma-70 family)